MEILIFKPSNFERINAMYSLEEVRKMFASYWLDDDGILDSIKNCYEKTGYTIDPHGAVAWKAWADIKNGEMAKLLNGQKNDITKSGLNHRFRKLRDFANKLKK